MFSRHTPFSSNDELAEIAAGLENLSLPFAKWTHAAHFAAALWFVERDEAEKMPALIRAYNVASGGANTDTSGFHQTITQASLRAARYHRKSLPNLPLFEVCNRLLDSRLGESDWIFEHWTRETLFSSLARRSWVEPDLRPLPF